MYGIGVLFYIDLAGASHFCLSVFIYLSISSPFSLLFPNGVWINHWWFTTSTDNKLMGNEKSRVMTEEASIRSGRRSQTFSSYRPMWLFICSDI